MSPHNALVAALMGTGIVGGLAVLAAGGGLAAALLVGALRSPERTPAVALALIGAALLVHGLVDVTWETPVLGVMLCLAAGVLPGAASRSLPVTLRYGVAAVGAAVAVLLASGAIRSGAGIVTANDAFLAPSPVQLLHAWPRASTRHQPAVTEWGRSWRCKHPISESPRPRISQAVSSCCAVDGSFQ